jgi:hypothetical protein
MNKKAVTTPLEKVEALYDELVIHYGEGEDREIRAAAKLLLVALARFKEHDGPRGIALVDEYLNLIKHDPDKFDRVIQSNRSEGCSTLIA